MKQHEFLAQLKSALENDLNEQDVKENLDYYREYIQSEIQKGVPEEDVLTQLGDPWAIAKTVILSEKIEDREQNLESDDKERRQESYGNSVQVISKGKKILIVLAIIAILLVVLSMAFGVIAIVIKLAIRFAVPIFVIWFVIKIVSKK